MKKLIPHLFIILTLMVITLVILDFLNPLMGFLTRSMSIVVLALWVLSIIATLIYIISIVFKKETTEN